MATRQNALYVRKTPRQKRSQATRAAILEAAAQLLSEDGLAAYNTNAVAARAGVSVGSIYQYYPNKDALMAALIAAQQGRQLERLQQAADASDGSSLETTVRAMVCAAMAHHVENALLAAAIDHEEARLPVDALISPFLKQAGVLLARVLARHSLPGIDPARAARTVPAMVRAVVDAWVDDDGGSAVVAEREATNAVLRYLQIGMSSFRDGG